MFAGDEKIMTDLSVSIITICWNCVDAIGPTMKSIFNQTYKNIECIVIDGGSNDGTREYLETIKGKLAVFISEKDRGIYNAMNKGIHFATGEYIIFMNAGDRFASDTAIENVMINQQIISQRPKIISGRTQLEYKGKLLNRYRPSKPGRGDSCLPHQATFIKTDLQKLHLYDERLRSVADYELWQRLRKIGLFEVVYIPDVLSIFCLGGKSNEIRHDSRRYLERAYVDSLYADKFGMIDWSKFFFKVLVRRIIYAIFGERALYSFLYFMKSKIFEKELAHSDPK